MSKRNATPERIAEELDGFIETRHVEAVTGYTRRWLAVLMARGKFPLPDAPAGTRGASHRWRRSTIRRYLDSLTNPKSAAS